MIAQNVNEKTMSRSVGQAFLSFSHLQGWCSDFYIFSQVSWFILATHQVYNKYVFLSRGGGKSKYRGCYINLTTFGDSRQLVIANLSFSYGGRHYHPLSSSLIEEVVILWIDIYLALYGENVYLIFRYYLTFTDRYRALCSRLCQRVRVLTVVHKCQVLYSWTFLSHVGCGFICKGRALYMTICRLAGSGL